MENKVIKQIGLAEEQILKGKVPEALIMLEHAAKMLKNESGAERLINDVLERTKISISIPNDLLKKIQEKSKKLQIGVSTCICLLLNNEIKL